ncbi:MAG: Exodeoxyribonuclease 7 large subunit [Phycisphaerae bacterium]|nr:Exodeoxyribonuclease 7 large subunit [Phycisphaerae bacterium]
MSRKPFNPDLIQPPPGDDADGPGEGPVSVAQLNAMVKRALARLPQRLAVAGEISNFTRAASGHLYFTLKDEQAAVRCVMWRSSAARLKFSPDDGLAVIAFGNVDLYEARGEYQLYVGRLTPQGRGELELAFRQLHEKLDKRGWFASERKRPIPFLPATIGVVTSRTGAAFHDILKTLAIRWPGVRVVLADARVQGEGAGESIARAIALLNRHAVAIGGVDVLIVGRGGGSLEDLWAFNTEPVAEAIFRSAIPVVSAVGHEVDTTIADLVADARAATPTAAAQLVVPDRGEIRERLASARSLLARRMSQQLADLRTQLRQCERFEAFRRPAAMLRGPRQLLDETSARLTAAWRETLHAAGARLADLAARLSRHHPRAALIGRWRSLDAIIGRLRWAADKQNRVAERRLTGRVARFDRAGPRVRLPKLADRLAAFERQLEAYNPRRVLKRGYSITRRKRDGALLTASAQAPAGEVLTTELADGTVQSVVAGGPPAPPTRRKRDGGDGDADQMNLGF